MGGDCVINLMISYTFGISIHAPRMGSDIIMQMVAEVYPISIHVSSVVSDFNLINSTMISLYFNSCSLRGAWCCIPKVVHGLLAISILAPCIGSDGINSPICSVPQFSIHAPRMRSDSARKVDMFSYKFFIHASRVGNDFRYPLRPLLYWVFNSRSSSEERPDATGGVINIITFQFTLSVWGVILICLYFVLIKCIFNSRPPHGERFSFLGHPRVQGHFNSRSPYGERRHPYFT